MEDGEERCRDHKEKLMIVERGGKQRRELEESEWIESAMWKENDQEKKRWR